MTITFFFRSSIRYDLPLSLRYHMASVEYICWTPYRHRHQIGRDDQLCSTDSSWHIPARHSGHAKHVITLAFLSSSTDNSGFSSFSWLLSYHCVAFSSASAFYTQSRGQYALTPSSHNVIGTQSSQLRSFVRPPFISTDGTLQSSSHSRWRISSISCHILVLRRSILALVSTIARVIFQDLAFSIRSSISSIMRCCFRP